MDSNLYGAFPVKWSFPFRYMQSDRRLTQAPTLSEWLTGVGVPLVDKNQIAQPPAGADAAELGTPRST
jgi:hypothetical protein